MTTPEKMSNTSETGEISQPLSLPDKRKSAEIGEGCPPPKGTEEVPEKESAEDVAQPPADGFQRGGKVYVPGKTNYDEFWEIFNKRGIPIDEFKTEEIYCIPPPPCKAVCICKRAH